MDVLMMINFESGKRTEDSVERTKKDFDARSRDLPELVVGTKVRIQDPQTKYDIPATVEKLARAANQTLIRDQHTEGGWTLEMHWNSTETLEKIHSRVWDVVVLQEYSTGLAKEDTKLCQSSYPFAQNLANEIREGSPEVELQFYQTWGRPYGEDSTCDTFSPNCDYFTMQDVISTNYETYACMFKPSRIAPVGESFRHVREELGETAFFELFETLGERDHHSSRQLFVREHRDPIYHDVEVLEVYAPDFTPKHELCLGGIHDEPIARRKPSKTRCPLI
eukprot:maker-scaffold733_size105121-snap-gene-0.21 protein:Tk04995 transcript:maker-scaffold733_size105121-snap-gene-0.21-mRNA-1 annotation:"hypothetical protein"